MILMEFVNLRNVLPNPLVLPVSACQAVMLQNVAVAIVLELIAPSALLTLIASLLGAVVLIIALLMGARPVNVVSLSLNATPVKLDVKPLAVEITAPRLTALHALITLGVSQAIHAQPRIALLMDVSQMYVVLLGKPLKLAKIKDYVQRLATIAAVVMAALKLTVLHAQISQDAFPVIPALKLNAIMMDAQQFHAHHPQPVKILVKAVQQDAPIQLVLVEVVRRLTVQLARTTILPVVRLRPVLSGTVLRMVAGLSIALLGFPHQLVSTRIYVLNLAPTPHAETIASKPIARPAVTTPHALLQQPAHRQNVID